MKNSNLSEDNFKKILDLDGSIPEPAKQSGDTGQRILGSGLQGTANEYAGERKINKDLISKNNKVDTLNSAKRILQD